MPGANLVDLWVPGEPVPKGRPRHYRGRVITPSRTLQAQRYIRDAVWKTYPKLKANGTLRFAVSLDFYIKHRRRRDVDNLAKLVMDALNNVIWVDDHQVVALTADLYRAGASPFLPDEPGTHLRVATIKRDPWA